ncbi:ATP-binding cassette domain-containing protein [Turicibacter sanguinis]|jgi:ABC transporter, ATP-binding protein|uniref:ABC transporter ATP-binding protein n=1 Tax=Turicibacter sanguinis TaxID=154288 RepID=UPI0012BCBB92|nr:ABC transporter ATP-binding protein [Turicibacter sanguinis]MDB8565907.1 ABC transporter ATP-binding protein [Turicibacter sanguinis]MDB8568659.1 ABC transporter ATP-binding protein [Turicibacter sanguinis]MDB8571408.1 ABC transporter ATP-binding protein [Turicibacter sanguinis]MDB8580167.1 ABC transporter ATP-binding protein [Turicibacter sanguinis]MTO10921.1 ATP-binding cassette domain-containing protein [Turicibacter sanguinis]
MSRPNRGPMAGAGAPIEKAKDTKKSVKKLLLFCQPHYLLIAFALIFSIVGTILTLIGPDKLSEVTDLITAGLMTGIDLDAVEDLCLLLVYMYGASFILSYFQGFIMNTVTQKVAKSLRTQISEKINRLPLRYFDSTSYGDILSRVTNDVDSIAQTLNQSVGNLVSAITLFFGSLFMMFITNAWMAITAILSTVIGFILMMFIMSKSQKYFIRQQRDLGLMNGHVEEIYSGHNIVKVYNDEAKAKAKFDEINEDLYESVWRSQFLSGLMMPLMSFIGNFGYVAVCIVGASLAMNEVITFGVIVAFMVYIRLFTQPLSQIAQAMTSLQQTAAASERVFEFLEEPEMQQENGKINDFTVSKGEVEFKHVHFGYHADRTIINDFSVTTKPGQKVAIVGPTGAGKTTMVNLLMKFYEANSGEILIDGMPINQLTRHNVHDLFGMVLQDTWIFEGTIRENIVYSMKNVSDEEVEKACKAVGIHHFIKTLPKGYETILNDKANLSAGQKQLITIARAMVENAPLLILDEATSSVDTRTEILIQEAMDKLMRGRTSFVIAHRLSTIKNANLILVMNHGDIIESGTHEQLMKQNGFYAELYNSQFEKLAE